MTSNKRRTTRQAHPRREAPRLPSLRALTVIVVLVGVTLAGTAVLMGTSGAMSSSGPSIVANEPTSPSIARANPTATRDSVADSPSDPATTPLSAPSTSLSSTPAGRFGLGLLIADRGNGRLLIVDAAHQILWRFPGSASLPGGQRFSADDAFLAPDGRTLVANDEAHQVIDRIDIVTRRVIWQYGHYDQAGSAPGYLDTPDDAYPLANGDITVADIRNCRVLEINPAKRIVHQWGRSGQCTHRPPVSFNNPNGDTPLPGGGLLITEIGGSRVVRLDAIGRVVFDIHVPAAYPSDAQLDPSGNVLVVDYSNPGAVLKVSPRGKVLWRYGPTAGAGRLDHPSLAITLPDGTIAVNDDYRARVVVIDPQTKTIVWQYGHTGIGGTANGSLFDPDGLDLIPAGTQLR